MKNFLPVLLLLSFNILTFGVKAQNQPFSSFETIDVGNIKSRVLVHGDMWSDPATTMQQCEFPKASGKHIAGTASIWMGGYDAQNNYCMAAQQYRSAGVDYWPGPLGVSGAGVSYAVSKDWARIWKIRRWELSMFLNTSVHTLQNTPASILEWPAKGNPHARGFNNASLTIAKDMAPFVDVNSDGTYNALNGDYPVMKGDQMLWYVFNDNGPTHSGSKSVPIGAQVKSMVYAYGRGTLADNIVFHEYEITNFHGTSLDSFALAVYADLDLGYAFDDYIGYDSSRNMGIVYNGTVIDGPEIKPDYYRDTIPKAAVKILRMPSDTCGQLSPAGSFMIITNGNDLVIGDPVTAHQMTNYMYHSWRDGSSLTDPGGNNRKYMYPDDPSLQGGWSDCTSNTLPFYNKRMVIASKPFKFPMNSTIKFAFALIASNPAYQNACPFASFADIKAVGDTAQYIFCNQLPVLTAVTDVAAPSALQLYPNPASDIITVHTAIAAPEQLKVVDAMGRFMAVHPTSKNKNVTIDISQLPAGIYWLIYNETKQTLRASFIKN